MDAIFALADMAPATAFIAATGVIAVGAALTFVAIRLSRKGVNQVK